MQLNPRMGDYEINRRRVLKAATATGAVGAGLQFAAAPALSWEQIPAEVRCLGCKSLGKIEAETNDGDDLEWTLETGSDVASGTVVDDTTFTFDIDGDGTEETRIELTDFQRKPGGEVTGFDFATNGLPITRVDVKGGTGTNFYDQLGTVVRGRDFTAPDNKGVSNVKFYYCPTIRICLLSGSVGFDPTSEIDITADDVRAALWWGPNNYGDQFLFDNGAAPSDGSRIIGDKDADGTSDVCFDFDLQEAAIDDPTAVQNPDEMKLSLVIEGADGNEFISETSDGVVALSPTTTPGDEVSDCEPIAWYQVDFVTGDPIVELGDGNLYGDRLIAAQHGNTNSLKYPYTVEDAVPDCLEAVAKDDDDVEIESEPIDVINGYTQAEVYVKYKDNCDETLTLSLAAHQKPGPDFDGGEYQVLFDSETKEIDSPGWYRFLVDLPQWEY